MNHIPWRVSLHGGHSGEFCDHADGSLREMIEAAVAAGCCVFGVTEHAPRFDSTFLYDKERAMGWTVETLAEMFAAYTNAINVLALEYAGRLTVLRGFEAEVLPAGQYKEVMRGFLDGGKFDYMVGSVHYVREILIDGEVEKFQKAMDLCGGLESLAIEYYAAVAEMVEALQPAVVGHFDVISKLAGPFGSVDTASIQSAAREALVAVKKHGCILDVNTAGYRKGLGRPYPAPFVVEMARDMGIPFCFGDDSHRPGEVGAGIDTAREYLLGLGVTEITVLARGNSVVHRRTISLA